jgi:hypothetical protein
VLPGCRMLAARCRACRHHDMRMRGRHTHTHTCTHTG